MKFVFVQLLAFSAKARKLRLTLDDLREIENDITAHPTRWPLVAGTNWSQENAVCPRCIRFRKERRLAGVLFHY